MPRQFVLLEYLAGEWYHPFSNLHKALLAYSLSSGKGLRVPGLGLVV